MDEIRPHVSQTGDVVHALSDSNYQKHLVLSVLPVDTCSSTWNVKQLCVGSGSFIWIEKLKFDSKILASNSHNYRCVMYHRIKQSSIIRVFRKYAKLALLVLLLTLYSHIFVFFYLH